MFVNIEHFAYSSRMLLCKSTIILGKSQGFTIIFCNFVSKPARRSAKIAMKPSWVLKPKFFLSRPRRFGKSLFVSTLQAYFEGKKDLFKGLAIENLEKEWVEYPVLHFDLSGGKYYSLENLHAILNVILLRQETKYGLKAEDPKAYSARLTNIFETARQQSGKQIVVLIDEYDAPMHDSMTNIQSLQHHQCLGRQGLQ